MKNLASIFISTICIVISIQAQNQLPVNGKFQLLPLPYPSSALSPYIGTETMETHWGKHVQGYVNNVNTMTEGTTFENISLEQIILTSTGSLYNNASQVYNHNLFFSILSAKAQQKPMGKLIIAIDKSFGSFEEFKEEFTKASLGLFGSGWVWLLKKDDGSLVIKQTPNGNCPIDEGFPLLNLDVWEHAYYLDYKNKRADYIDAFWSILNWKAVEVRYDK